MSDKMNDNMSDKSKSDKMKGNRVTIISGGYGSGKTEVSLNLACKFREEAPLTPVYLVDLDIVNPYFRSRQVRGLLGERDIKVVSSMPGLEMADIPALSPEIISILQDERSLTVFDVGGDPAGARALGRFKHYLDSVPYQFLMVINANRPFTRDPDSVIRLLREIEEASRLKVTGLISNTHMLHETDMDDIRKGLSLVREISKRTGLPIAYLAFEASLLDEVEAEKTGLPLLPIDLHMKRPWES